jgi:hypothetical protein
VRKIAAKFIEKMEKLGQFRDKKKMIFSNCETHFFFKKMRNSMKNLPKNIRFSTTKKTCFKTKKRGFSYEKTNQKLVFPMKTAKNYQKTHHCPNGKQKIVRLGQKRR